MLVLSFTLATLTSGTIYHLKRKREKQAESELRRANEELEGRVDERTADLLIANERLHQELTERTRAEEEIVRLNSDLESRAADLEAANRELETFNYTV